MRLVDIGSAASPPASSGLRWAEEWLPLVAVAALGMGTTAALGGTASADLRLTLGGAAVAALGLLVLMADDGVDPLIVLALTLPLPALYASAAVRLAPAGPMTALIIVAWVLAWPGRNETLRTARLPVLATLLLMSAFAFAGVISPHRGDAVREVANLGILLLLLVMATDLIARRPERAFPLVNTLAGMAAVTGALAVLESIGVLPGRFPEPAGYNRAALGFGQPNGLGMFLALSLPFVIHVRQVAGTRAVRWVTTLAVAATMAGLVATFSRGSCLSVLMGAAVLPFVGQWRFTLRIWGTALLAGLAVDLASGGVVWDALSGLLQDWSVVQRAALMLAGVEMFLQHPILGVGPGGFMAELDRIGAVVPQLWDVQPTAHNAYIQVAAEAGVVGLAAFATFLFALFRRGVRLARSQANLREHSLHVAVLWALAIALAEGMVEWPFSHGYGQLVMLTAALACALPLAVAGDPNEETAGPRRDPQ